MPKPLPPSDDASAKPTKPTKPARPKPGEPVPPVATETSAPVDVPLPSASNKPSVPALRADLRTSFAAGAKPTGDDFAQLIQSFVHATEDGLTAKDGKLGIGTTEPVGTLHVKGNVTGEAGAALVENAATGESWVILRLRNQDASGASDGVIFKNSSDRSGDGGANAMTVRNMKGSLLLQSEGGTGLYVEARTGNVAISSNAPGAKLDIGGNEDGAFQAILTRANDACFQLVAQNRSSSNQPNAEVSRLGVNYDRKQWDTGLIFFRGGEDDDGKMGFMTGGGKEQVRIDHQGNVGIGTASPLTKLHVMGPSSKTVANNERVFVATTNDSPNPFGVDIRLSGSSTAANRVAVMQTGEINLNDTGSLVFQPLGGNVGIGTTSPTQAKLVVNGSCATAQGVHGYLAYNGYGANAEANTINTSIYASDAVMAASYQAVSDERTKRIKALSDSAEDLATLLQLQVTDYFYVDTLKKGTGKQKKLIAQQVEKVFPQAVSRHFDVVPDIYQRASIANGWVQLDTDLKKGERVRLIGEKDEGLHEVLEVRDGAFRTAYQPTTDQVFVYGREVADFRTLDYDAIAMLNVSATQALHARVQQQASEIEQRDTRIAELEKRLAQLETKAATAESRFARLEALLTTRAAA